jgi:anthranilate/para-aminobenzoate synthase component II
MPDSQIIAIAAAPGPDADALAEAVRRSGAVPLSIPPDQAGSPEDALGGADGFIMSSGPAESPGGPAEGQEVRLIVAALEIDMPVLAVGDGMHALNVALGGALPSEVAGHGADGEGDSTYHRIFIPVGSRLGKIVGSGGFVRVNSRHRLGIKEARKSPLLLAAAYSVEDGVIEALESHDHQWVIGVQFRPERPKEVPRHFDRLFQGLVERAGAAGI